MLPLPDLLTITLDLNREKSLLEAYPFFHCHPFSRHPSRWSRCIAPPFNEILSFDSRRFLHNFARTATSSRTMSRCSAGSTPHTCTALRSLAPPARAGVVQCRCRRHEPSMFPQRQRWICHSQPLPFTLPNSVITSHYGKFFSISLLSVVRLLFLYHRLVTSLDIDTIPF